MNATRAQITELLREGLSNTAIAARLHCDKKRVAARRQQLGLPNVVQQALSLEEKWTANTQPLDDGHIEWTGERQATSRTPVMRYREQSYSPAAIAFRIHTGREPEGYVYADCGLQHCVAPAHVDDEPGRQRTREQFRYLRGGRPPKDECINGHDLSEHVRYTPDSRAYCGACKAAQHHEAEVA
ncbi:hypothetical protein ACFV3E_24750 [Streptomyces sp. NPDC059718]